ncbi:MAG TPA: hypothetical protein PK573_13885 [Spirochaetota bacterium]|nr:hypothetical protein [Spirochaetota bacterium]HRZ25921.1 hypothetical protein [Spirochaetota bacterium]
MASVQLNPVFTGMSGTVGRFVFYRWNDRTVMRLYVVPRNPDTPAQRANRGLFRDAMKAWQALADDEKAAWNRRASRLGMTGHNLFISRYMRSHAAGRVAARVGDGCAAVPASPSCGLLASFLPSLSVAAPSGQACRVFSRQPAAESPPWE